MLVSMSVSVRVWTCRRSACVFFIFFITSVCIRSCVRLSENKENSYSEGQEEVGLYTGKSRVIPPEKETQIWKNRFNGICMFMLFVNAEDIWG